MPDQSSQSQLGASYPQFDSHDEDTQIHQAMQRAAPIARSNLTLDFTNVPQLVLSSADRFGISEEGNSYFALE